MNVQKDYEELFELLNRQGVEYLIVGAYALAFYGQPRYTGDLDIFIRISRKNSNRLYKVVDEFGFKGVGIAPEDFLKKGRIVQLGYLPVRVDIITSIDGVSFKSAWSGRTQGEYGEQKVWYLSKKDLIKNKKASGRVRDLQDLELLGVTSIQKRRVKKLKSS